MYFIDVNGLIDHLKNERNTTYESYQYLLGYVVVGFFSPDLIMGAKEVKPLQPVNIALFFAELLLGGLIAWFVLRLYYRSNGGDQGRHFVDRLLAVSWVVGCRSMTFIFFPFAAATLVLMWMGGGFPGAEITEGEAATGLVWIGLAILALITGFVWMMIAILVGTNTALKKISTLRSDS